MGFLEYEDITTPQMLLISNIFHMVVKTYIWKNLIFVFNFRSRFVKRLFMCTISSSRFLYSSFLMSDVFDLFTDILLYCIFTYNHVIGIIIFNSRLYGWFASVILVVSYYKHSKLYANTIASSAYFLQYTLTVPVKISDYFYVRAN